MSVAAVGEAVVAEVEPPPRSGRAIRRRAMRRERMQERDVAGLELEQRGARRVDGLHAEVMEHAVFGSEAAAIVLAEEDLGRSVLARRAIDGDDRGGERARELGPSDVIL